MTSPLEERVHLWGPSFRQPSAIHVSQLHHRFSIDRRSGLQTAARKSRTSSNARLAPFVGEAEGDIAQREAMHVLRTYRPLAGNHPNMRDCG